MWSRGRFRYENKDQSEHGGHRAAEAMRKLQARAADGVHRYRQAEERYGVEVHRGSDARRPHGIPRHPRSKLCVAGYGRHEMPGLVLRHMNDPHSYPADGAPRQGSRSASPLSHAESPGAFARLAFALYSVRSARVTRTFIRTLEGSLMGGLPRPRFAWFMGSNCTH
jgi:hypothetical protein